MRFGTCHLWGDSLEEFRSEVRLAAELGYEIIGIGDTTPAWRELFVSMTVAAQEAPAATIMPFVTSPFVRHPLTAANGLCSLNELSGGRIALGLSTGGGNVMSIGRPQATQAEIRDYWQALRGLFAGESVTYKGRSISPLRYHSDIPVYYSAFGPKALQLAGEYADGVILFTNGDLKELDEKVALIAEGAERAGRDVGDVEVILAAFCSVRETREAAIEDIKPFIVAGGMALLAPAAWEQVPEQYRPALKELQRRYDPSEHVVVGGNNVKAMEELGLTEFFAGFNCIAGTPAYVGEVLERLDNWGASAFVVPLPGHADKEGTLRRIAQLRPRPPSFQR